LPISQNNSCESLIKKMTLIAQAVGVLFIGYPTMGCGAAFDETTMASGRAVVVFFCGMIYHIRK
jgi:hypothetical protein